MKFDDEPCYPEIRCLLDNANNRREVLFSLSDDADENNCM